MDLSNKIAIVTGASRGIGYAIADTLASYGANIVCVSTRQSVCDEVAAALQETYGVACIGIAADVSSFEDGASVVKTVIGKFGRVDILVNNAGITRDNLMLRMSLEEWTDVISVNLNSVFNFTKAVLKPMLKNRYGRIVNISSVVGVMGNAGQANYAASKAGIIGFSKSIAREFGAKNITCNVVAPGFIETDMIQSLPKDYLDTIMASIPQKRLGSAREVAEMVSFLASDLAAYTTGQVLHVDGGMQM
ncbi:MAG: 3-oxoacyl-[acyl-carrier-protein] reductase [Candidatus Margulisbacteria bacterium]|nr:3-oxoacyl-[acyl-carrier-protein] reductase [Candidatus Margulisiibacteriota bacterium]